MRQTELRTGSTCGRPGCAQRAAEMTAHLCDWTQELIAARSNAVAAVSAAGKVRGARLCRGGSSRHRRAAPLRLRLGAYYARICKHELTPSDSAMGAHVVPHLRHGW